MGGSGGSTLLTPTDVRRLLADHSLAPAKRLGQNFVVDANTVRKVVHTAGVQAGDVVVEVGPGLGSLTLALRGAGATVVAVEVDAGMVRALRAVLGADEAVRIVHADALHTDLAALAGDASHPLLVANLPYNIATGVVLRALATERFARLTLMVQREVGERWVAGAGAGRYGGVSVKIAAFAAARLAGRVARNAFYPVPNVDSVTVTLEPRPWPYDVDRPAVLTLVDEGFAQRRKRLRNALARPDRPPASIEAFLTAAGLDPGARAEELDLAAWAALAALVPPAADAYHAQCRR